jgi:hypothetical protein
MSFDTTVVRSQGAMAARVPHRLLTLSATSVKDHKETAVEIDGRNCKRKYADYRQSILRFVTLTRHHVIVIGII